jgi:amino acid transporter
VRLRRSLGTLALVFVMFFNISGGPFTTETLIAETGPGLGLLILILVPLVWSVPETLIVGELASMLPEEGGYYRWVYRAFGRFWAFQNGWWTWMYSLVDMAIYPVLFNQYLHYFVPGIGARGQWLVALVVIWGATAVNLRGALRVGWVSIITGFFILTSFLALSGAALLHAHHSPVRPFLPPSHDAVGALGVGLSIALWNYIGWDNPSTVQGEVVDASRSYPRALAIALPLVVLNYLVPLTAALSASDWHAWTGADWADIARLTGGVAGSVLAPLIALCGMLSALGLFNALLLSYSRIPLAMAADGMLPAALARTDDAGTPRNAVLSAAVLYSLFALLSFVHLVVADVLLYAMALSLEFGALIALRRHEPQLRGTFRIPVGLAGVVTLAALPVAILCVVVAMEIHDAQGGLPAVLGSVAAMAVGVIVYAVGRKLQAD